MNGRKTSCLIIPGSVASTHVYRYSCLISGSELTLWVIALDYNKYFL